MISLTPRLEAVASFVRDGVRLADVGTDHGYIPSYLILKDKIKSAVAGDIGVMPLESAKATVEKYGLSDRIKTVLSDGLECIEPNEIDDIVIAGMGGELIVKILQNALWVKNEKYHLILQPMTHSEDVRKFLFENGFYVENEICVTEGNKVYIVMSVFYDGEKRDFDGFAVYFGLLDNSDASKAYRNRQLDRLIKKKQGAVCSDNAELEKELNLLIDLYGGVYGEIK